MSAPERAGRPGDQPLPTPGQQDVIGDLIAELEAHPRLDPTAVRIVRGALERRLSIGIRRYGRPLETFNGRDAHQDELEEFVDGFVYRHQLKLERAALEEALAEARARLAEIKGG